MTDEDWQAIADESGLIVPGRLMEAAAHRVSRIVRERDELLAALRVLTAAVPNCVASYRTNNARKTVGAALETARAVIDRAGSQPLPDRR